MYREKSPYGEFGLIILNILDECIGQLAPCRERAERVWKL
jgi:hypothetical protein